MGPFLRDGGLSDRGFLPLLRDFGSRTSHWLGHNVLKICQRLPLCLPHLPFLSFFFRGVTPAALRPPPVAPCVSYSKSFTPNLGVSFSEDPTKPSSLHSKALGCLSLSKGAVCWAKRSVTRILDHGLRVNNPNSD